MTKDVAAIDLGSNSCRLVIANEKGEYLYVDAQKAKLAEGMAKDLMLTESAFNRGLNILAVFANKMAELGVEKYRAITTAAVRQAKNGQDFVNAVKEKTGLVFEVVNEFEEARLNLVGAMVHVAEKSKYVCVFDIGGASTEVTIATNENNPKIIKTTSIPYGARNATEKFGLGEYNEEGANKLKVEIRKYIKDFVLPDECLTIATSSTSLRMAAMIYKHEKYSRETSDGLMLSNSQIDSAVASIYKMNKEEREQNIYLDHRGAIFIPACILIETIVHELKIDKITASLLSAKDAIIRELIEND